MRIYQRQRSSGFGLLLMLVVLMGIGGVVVAGYTQGAKDEAERERYRHNERVLREAKHALLQFAYNYPQYFDQGPGRLPCPSPDQTGLTGPLSSSLCDDNVGRLPWAEPELHFYQARDASGEQLWYAVSDNFHNLGGGGVINSSTQGRITIQDRSGGVVYDGTAEGVAAVIIAPGPAIERNGVMQDRAADPNDPVNYLDIFGALDNADFVSGSANGFVAGPIEDLVSGTLLVNDQMIVITTQEIIALAEKAVLQTYSEALQDYSDRISTEVAPPPAPWNRYYPWLFNYSVASLDDFPASQIGFADELASSLTTIGRVPSYFSDYFSESASAPIESELYFDFDLTYPIMTPIGYDQVTPSAATGTMLFNNAAQHKFVDVLTRPQIIQFQDIADSVGSDGRMNSTAITNETFQAVLYFWDESALGPPTGVWTLCQAGGDSLSDCNRDSFGNPTPGSASNDAAVEVLKVTAEIDFNGTVAFDLDYDNPPTINVSGAANAGDHATVDALYPPAAIISLPVTLSYEYDSFYEASFDVQATGTLVTGDLDIIGTVTLGLRYYPELPAWVAANDWHESVLLAYAHPYGPDHISTPADCSEGADCLEFVAFPGNRDNKKALLVIAGEVDWLDDDLDGFDDELEDVFNPENSDLDRIFDVRTVDDPLPPGDTELDKTLVIEEL